MKWTVVIGLTLLVAASADHHLRAKTGARVQKDPATDQSDPIEPARAAVLSLMNMVGGAIRKTTASLNEQAEKTGEHIGEHLAEDQEKPEHSVETKMEAAAEGLKDSIKDGASMLQVGLKDARQVFESKDVQEEIFVAVDPVRKNPQFEYFNRLLDTFGQQGQQAVDKAMAQAEAQVKDPKTKEFLASARRSFNEGREQEQAKLEQIAQDNKEEAKEEIDAQKQEVHEKMNNLIEKAAEVSRLGMDAAKDGVRDAKAAAAEKMQPEV